VEISGVEAGYPPMKYRRMIVNRKRQLELVEEDLPNPRPGEVRLRMLAAGVSYPDVMMRQGIHPEARRPPFTPGWDVVGTVDVLGEGVEAVPLGATVAAMPIVGGYAATSASRPQNSSVCRRSLILPRRCASS
jgi:NADPH2:quinone reductase